MTDPPPPPGLREAWLAEMWPAVRELPRWERVEKRQADRIVQRLCEEAQLMHRSSTGCAETRPQEPPDDADAPSPAGGQWVASQLTAPAGADNTGARGLAGWKEPTDMSVGNTADRWPA